MNYAFNMMAVVLALGVLVLIGCNPATNMTAIGDKYLSEGKDDKKFRQGTYTYSNGDKYKGNGKIIKRMDKELGIMDMEINT